jgi:shikimate kinase
MGQNIVLLGFMGTGKTVVGRELARRLGYRYVDTDSIIEAMAKKPIPRIFAEDGEPHFRDLETRATERVVQLTHHVIATGGGIVMRDENLANLRRAGPLICLKATPRVIYERTKSDQYRPLLQTPDPLAKIKELLRRRAAQYAKADLHIDTSHLTVNEVVEQVLTALHRLFRDRGQTHFLLDKDNAP